MQIPKRLYLAAVIFILPALFCGQALHAQASINHCSAPIDPAISPWCEQKAAFKALEGDLTVTTNDFNRSVAVIGSDSPAAAELAKDYASQLCVQMTTLNKIGLKIDEIIGVSMLPPMGNKTAYTSVRLAELRADLAILIAQYKNPSAAEETDKSCNNEKPAPNNGGKSDASPTQPDGQTAKPVGKNPPTDPNTKTNPHTSPVDANAAPKPETQPTISTTTSAPANNAGIIINATSVGNTATTPTNGESESGMAPAATPAPTPKSGTKKKATGGTGDGTKKKGTGGVSGNDAKDPSTGGKGSGDSSNNSLPGATGLLTGTILDYDTQKPIPKAIVIARCGDNGQYVYTTRTNVFGQYIFPSLPVGNCLVRAAKWLSPVEADKAKDEWSARRSDFTTAAERSLPPNASFLARYKAKYVAMRQAADELPEKDWAYQEDTVNNLEVTSGEQTIVTDLLLHKRANAIGEFARTIVGFQQSGANSADSAQRFFLDLWLSTPAPFSALYSGSQSPWNSDPNFGTRFRFWGDIRVTSTPQQIQSSLGDFVVGFPEQLAKLPVNEIAQSAELMGGGEVRLMKWGATNNRLLSFDSSARERFALYFTLGGGFTTPIEPASFTDVFVNPIPGTEPNFDQQIAKLGLTNQIADKKFIAFVSQDRVKFLGQYYGGIRTKTFYYDRYTDEPLRRFPATLDVLVGQNQSVTGGIYRRVVLRLDGFYPLPYESVKFIYLFGTADKVLGGPRSETPILLQDGTNIAPPIPDPSIFLMPPLRQLNRDQYRIGAGIDIIQLISSIKNINVNKPTTGKPSKSTSGTETSTSDSSN